MPKQVNFVSMNKRLIYIALLTSPVIAVYGVIPIVLFNSIGWLQSIVSFIALTIGILFFWFFNIFLIHRGIPATTRYLLSYLATFILHTGSVYIMTSSQGLLNPVNFLVYSFVATLAVNTIILVIINAELLKRKKDFVESEFQKLKVVSLEAQKKVLLQQLHPHFLFNALSTLKSLINVNTGQAEDYLVRLSEFLRYSITGHSNELVTLKEELQFALDYMELQKVRFGDALNCTTEIPSGKLSLKIPAFALQTLLENAVKHNSFTVKNPLNIEIKEDQGRIRVTNNKSPKPLVQASGTGLKNLDERYRMMAGVSVEVVDHERDFTVYLNLLDK